MSSPRTSRGDDLEGASDVTKSTSTIVPTASAELTSLTSLQITNHKLNGCNFLQLSRFVQMVIRGKGKFGYLDGSIAKPSPDNPSFQTWDIQNSMAMAWLVHSMEDSIGETYLFYSTAKGIWDAVHLAYSNYDYTSQVFELQNRARSLKQGDLDVTRYFNLLKKLWQELDLFHFCDWKDPEDAILYKKMLTKERIYDFLAGLNQDLDEVRGRILGTKLQLPIDEMYAEVHREESRKRVLLKNQSFVVSPSETSALVTLGYS